MNGITSAEDQQQLKALNQGVSNDRHFKQQRLKQLGVSDNCIEAKDNSDGQIQTMISFKSWLNHT